MYILNLGLFIMSNDALICSLHVPVGVGGSVLRRQCLLYFSRIQREVVVSKDF